MSEITKNGKPIDDFNWDEFENGSSVGVSKEELDKAYQEMQKIKELNHMIVNGKIISIDWKEVIVNIGYKSNGIIPASEFRYNPDLKIGDVVEVYVESVENTKGIFILSHKKARLSKSWDRIKLAFDDDRIVQGYIKCRTNGGMIVDVFGLETFLPDSQIGVQPIQDYNQFVGKTMEFRIVKIVNDPKFVVISHRAITDPNYDAYPLSKEIKIAVNSGIIIDEHDYDSKDFDEEYEEFMKNAYGEERKKTDNPPDISQMFRTYGRLQPCPHCGSRNVNTYCDGTAKCNDCDKWYYYA